jgi:hypothetical protein
MNEFRVLQENNGNYSKVMAIMKRMLSDKYFPNVAIAFKIYMTIPFLMCEGKREFSKPSFIKNETKTSAPESTDCIEFTTH